MITGFIAYLTANENDIKWVEVVAQAFEVAGSVGNMTLSSASIEATLRANGVTERRQSLEIPPVQAIGNPPTSGYSNDPINTATGNFVENEQDLAFEGASSLLGWVRSYSSLSDAVGAFGPGWASFDGFGIRLDDDGAHWTLVDGREVLFPRLDGGFDRATHENFWLVRTADGLEVSNNAGARWRFTAAGLPTSFRITDGSEVTFVHDADRLTGLHHSRGRSLEVRWDGDRITAVVADDGRRVDYGYDEQRRLVSATGPLGTRRYDWDEQGLVAAVVDADGVVEARNTYDDQRRVATQVSSFGRTTRFTYLPGRVTDVSDVDGSRANTWVADARGRVIGIVDSDGNRSSMSWDRHGNQVLATDPEGRQTVRAFDERGRLVTELQPNGAMTRLAYDDLDRLLSITESSDGVEVATTTFAYTDDQQQPCLVTDGEGGRTRMTWQDGLLQAAVDPTGVEVRFTYDEHGELASSTDADGNTSTITRDAAGRVVATATPSGATTRFEPDERGLLVGRTEPDGAQWRYEYSTGGRLATIVDPLGARTVLEYGDHGELAATIDPLGRRVEQEFDDLGNVSRVRLPDGALWEFAHDAMSRLVQTVDPTGGTWLRHHDRFGRLNETIDPTGVRTVQHVSTATGEVSIGDASSTTTWRTDRWGREVTTVLPDGSETVVRHDRNGRPVEYVDAVGGRTTVERDPAGRPLRIRRPSGSVVRYDYDGVGRLAGVTNELGSRTQIGYDVDSRAVSETCPTGERGWTRRDVCGRVTARHVPGLGAQHWTYDKAGRVVETRDAWSGRRTFRYDAAGQLVAATNGNGGTTRYEYDANGRAVRITDPMGGVTERTFDAMNRCTSETDPLGRTSSVTYDGAGRVLRNIDADGHVLELGYDEAGLHRDLLADGRLLSRTVHDPAHRVVTTTDHTDPGRTVTHEQRFDPRGLLVEQSRDGATTRWFWDADGLTSSVTAPNGALTSYRRDAAGAVVEVAHAGLATAVLTRDQVGRLVRATAGDRIDEWAWDDGFVARHASGGRVTTIEHDDDGRTSRVGSDGGATRYRYDDAGQLVAAESADGTNTWRYDLGGRLVDEQLDGQVWQRTYDAAGQLLQATSGERTIRYGYDRSGRRTREQDSDGSSREFEWTATWRLASVTSTTAGSTTRTTTLVDALGQLARVDDEELFWDDTTGELLQAGDRSLVQAGPLSGVAGQGWLDADWRPERQTVVTNPWLPPAAQSGTGGLQLGAGGAVLVAGMEWLGARVLDPSSRGFLSPDPLEPTTGAGWSANPYSYAGNSPLDLLDPSGLHPLTAQGIDDYRKANAPKWGTALAMAAGVALLFVPGGLGLEATIMSGVVLGGGSNLIDQWCTGYTIDQAEVTRSAAAGGIGAGIGYGLGSLLGTAAKGLAKSPLGEGASSLFNRGSSAVADLTESLRSRAARGISKATDMAKSGWSWVSNHANGLRSAAKNSPSPELHPATYYLDRIHPTEGPRRPGSIVPRSFNLETQDSTIWVHPNATKHISEETRGLALSRPIAEQNRLESLVKAIDSMDIRDFGTTQVHNGWELTISQAREPGLNDTLKHARHLGGS